MSEYIDHLDWGFDKQQQIECLRVDQLPACECVWNVFINVVKQISVCVCVCVYVCVCVCVKLGKWWSWAWIE